QPKDSDLVTPSRILHCKTQCAQSTIAFCNASTTRNPCGPIPKAAKINRRQRNKFTARHLQQAAYRGHERITGEMNSTLQVKTELGRRNGHHRLFPGGTISIVFISQAPFEIPVRGAKILHSFARPSEDDGNFRRERVPAAWVLL
ncbi:MAG TPA: hypothetical protein VL970_08175, partial [Candidatus Acidoferrales bacterium]|nr:hypothetical protein [Candidatus Acidoferrales bacterium]